MEMYEQHIGKLQSLLEENADPKVKDWWENYVKGSAPFRGVKMSLIRSTLHRWYQQDISAYLDVNQQMDLALALFPQEYTEDKLAGTLFLADILMPKGAVQRPRDVMRFSTLFNAGHIYDWNVCDWFCVKVLGSLIAAGGGPWAKDISAWHDAGNLWLARASVVPFTKVANDENYYSLVGKSCAVLIKRDERFAKTAVGWILRDISKHDREFVEQFIENNLVYFSTESLRNALKYASKDEQKYYLGLMRKAQKSTTAGS
jgi:3-methyladenine DNA glycosylase AlkD